MDETIQNEAQQGENLEAEADQEVVVDNFVDDETKKVLQTEIARKKHWKEKYLKAKKAEDELKTVKEKLAAFENKPQSDAIPQDRLAKIELQVRGYNDQEAAFILRNGGNADDPYVQAAIQTMRQKAQAEQATPAPTGRSATVSAKPFTALPRGEQKSAYEQTVKTLLEKARK